MLKHPAHPDAAEIGEIMDIVGEQLTSTLSAVIRAVPGGPYRPQQFARMLGVNKDLSSRVLAASEKRDPVAALHQMPGPAPLRHFLEAAAEKGVPPELLQTALRAVEEFESLIRSYAGDRVSLDAIISTWLPEARERFELFNRQPIYRGMAQLKGVSVEVTINTAILNVSDDGRRLDGVWLMGSQGLRRIRPDAVIRYYSHRLPQEDGERSPFTLDREPVEHLEGLMLEDFCSHPLPDLIASRHGATVHYVLSGNRVGPAHAVDLYFAELTPGCLPRYLNPDSPRRHGPASEILLPTKLLIFDLLIHKNAYPGSDPELLVYDMGSNGVADMNDRARDIDLIKSNDSIVPLGNGFSMLRVPEMRNYIDIVRSVLNRLGWDENDFRAFRCKSQYPIYGSQYSMAFTPPADGE